MSSTTTATASASAETTTTTAATTPYDYSGTDMKSVALNISSLSFFILPFILYYIVKQDILNEAITISLLNNSNTTTTISKKQYYSIIAIGSTILLYVIAYMAPPIGWRRPHPYSDDSTNVPYILFPPPPSSSTKVTATKTQ